MKRSAEKRRKEEDKKVQKMIKNWDVVHCHICGNKISMTADAKMTPDGQYFICKNGCNNG